MTREEANRTGFLSAVDRPCGLRGLFDDRGSALYEAAAQTLLRYWLALVNLALAMLVALALLAPLLQAVGWDRAAELIYGAFQLICHQRPERSFFLLGEQAVYSPTAIIAASGELGTGTFLGNSFVGFKMAFCQRDLAIYGSMLLCGLAFTRVRGRLFPPSMPVLGVLLLPIAADGLTQLVGWRESTWQLRILTGTLFGAAAVWLILPQIDLSTRRAARRLGFE